MNLKLARNSHWLDHLESEMDRLFGDFFADGVRDGERSHSGYPACNVWEDDDRIYVESELPGVPRDKIDISFADHKLTIRGERSKVSGDDEASHCVERVCGSFHRAIHIPAEVKHDALEATLKDGVLTVTLPKAESIKPRKIAVK